MEEMKRILVLGGGAAGIAAAIAAKETAGDSADVVLVEQFPRVGKKLLATGNGRCNLDNEDIAPDKYFTANPGQLARMLSAMGDPLQWFRDHGLVTRTDEAGRVYPWSQQASDVLNLLLLHMEKLGVRVKMDSKVKAVTKKGATYTALLDGGTKLFGNAVVLAMGGKAGPQFGTDGFALSLAEELGLKTEESYPCLVPLATKKQEIAGLSGIRVKAKATLCDGSEQISAEDGEIQFTAYGLSGIAIMQLSGFLPRLYRPEISLDLFPHIDEVELLSLLQNRLGILGETTPEQYLTGLLNSRVGQAVWKAAGLSEEKVSPEELVSLAKTLKNWRFTGLRATDYQSAQTTGGGVCLSAVSPETFEVRGMPGLYLVGESLDVAGMCGGFNLHWAFGSGIAAGKAAGAI